MSAPTPPPAGIAAFRIHFPLQEANTKAISTGFVSHPHEMCVSDGWSIEATPTMGSNFRTLGGVATIGVAVPAAIESALPPIRMPRFELAAMGGLLQEIDDPLAFVPPPFCEATMRVPAAEPAERFLDFAYADVRPQPVRMPRFELAAMDGIPELDEQSAFVEPPVCETWMRVPAAEPAERFLTFAYADVRPAIAPVVLPTLGDLPVTPTFVRFVDEFAPTLRPEMAASSVFAVADSRPAPYLWPASMLRFSVHAIDDLSAGAPARAEAPRAAGPVTAAEPEPVESMPSVAAFVAGVLPVSVETVLPTVHCLTAQVLPQARAVAGPPPMPVETMPAAGGVRVAAMQMGPALCLPSLARFRPATDSADLLAAPVVAPSPVPVESMPSIAAFAAKPLAAAPKVVMARAFLPRLRAELPIPVVPLPAPHAVAPRMRTMRSVSLDPLSRIAAQPEGAQPERPKPAVPQPELIPLEYYSQRIASTPVKRLDALQSKMTLRLQAWAIRPVLTRLNVQAKNRLVLPFEQLFAKRGNPNGRRVNISVAGKIAATVMVGLALWAGSRVANISQHSEELRADVAASDGTVNLAASRDPNARFGKGPVGNLRRAIAKRAATEVTDSFKAGMTAWGAQPKTLAAGWKKHPEGYVSVGEMALFQPSLQYTNYRMEFYGQIEEKSMSWVVRAQDKKNYYAMKFKVIEPGLRPIIAMVHYGVVNGKAGHKSETPLAVMVHNNQPYHVAVNVHGNHFTASIEGETVESWTDDTLSKGGVGFFADAGEKARLYWMRFSSNQDWLGRMCAYLSGDGRSRQQTAELWAPEIPHDKPEPVHPSGADLALAAALENNSPGKAKTAKQRRDEQWIS